MFLGVSVMGRDHGVLGTHSGWRTDEYADRLCDTGGVKQLSFRAQILVTWNGAHHQHTSDKEDHSEGDVHPSDGQTDICRLRLLPEELMWLHTTQAHIGH